MCLATCSLGQTIQYIHHSQNGCLNSDQLNHLPCCFGRWGYVAVSWSILYWWYSSLQSIHWLHWWHCKHAKHLSSCSTATQWYSCETVTVYMWLGSFYQQDHMIAWSGAPAPLHLPISQMAMSLLPSRKTTREKEKETMQMKKIEII